MSDYSEIIKTSQAVKDLFYKCKMREDKFEKSADLIRNRYYNNY